MLSQRLNPIIVEAEQRSPEWFKERLGNVTGSQVGKTHSYYAVTKKQLEQADQLFAEEPSLSEMVDAEILARLREQYPFEYCLRAGLELKEAAERANYRHNLVGERLTGLPAEPEQFQNYAMKWGVISEPVARSLYQLKYKSIVADAPFMKHPTWACGASPDGLIVDRETGLLGTLEIKCLMTANHLYKIIQQNTVPEDYIAQIQMQLWITGRDFCDFVGYDSRLPEGIEIFVKRVERDDFYIDYVLVPSIRRFLDECDKEFRMFWAKLTERGRITSRLTMPAFAVKEQSNE